MIQSKNYLRYGYDGIFPNVPKYDNFKINQLTPNKIYVNEISKLLNINMFVVRCLQSTLPSLDLLPESFKIGGKFQISQGLESQN